MQLHEGTNALWVWCVFSSGVLLAVGRLELGASETSNTEVDIPKTSFTLLSGDVPFHQDTTWSRTLSTNDDVRHLERALVTALLANLEARLGVVHVGEEVASDEEHAVDFANHLDVLLGRDSHSLSDEVGTVVNVENLSVLKTVDSSLDRSRIISRAVTLCALGLEADELSDRNVLVLGLATLEPAVLALKALWLGWSTINVTLHTSLFRASSHGITLRPGVDLLAAREDDVTAHALNGSGFASTKVNIVENERTTGSGDAVLCEGRVDSNGSVDKLAIEQKDRADGLVGRAIGHVKSNLAVVDGDALVREDPVPVLEDGSTAVVEGHVADSKLLGAEEGTDGATVESEVGHEATGAVVLKDAFLLSTSVTLGHLENNVLKTGGLRNLPMDTGSNLGGRDINDKVADLAVEVVLVGVPIGAVASWDIGIRIDHAHTFKVCRSLENRHVQWITNELCVVVLDEGFADDVGTGGEIDERRSRCRRVAALATAIASSDDLVDNIGVISDAIALCTHLLDIAENLVRVWGWVEWCFALSLDSFKPVSRRSGLCYSWCLRNRRGRGCCCGEEYAQRQKKRSSAKGDHDSSACVEVRCC